MVGALHTRIMGDDAPSRAPRLECSITIYRDESALAYRTAIEEMMGVIR
jgi:hypothetical protein